MIPRLIAAVLALAYAGQKPADTRWTDLAPKDAGFSVQVPGTPKPGPLKPGHYEHQVGDSSFMTDVAALDDATRGLLAGDRAAIAAYLATTRDDAISAMKATVLSSSAADFNGWPSVLFSFGGAINARPFEGRQRVVVTGDRLYAIVAIGWKDELKTSDVDRFFASFQLIAPAPLPPAAIGAVAPAADNKPASAPSKSSAGTRTVSFTDAVCGRIPAVPITFEMPADFVSRPAGRSSEGGCLWGVKADLDHVTADPSQGDFTNLQRGVFRARISTEVVCSPETGIFDQMDGSGEAGIRQGLQALGANVVIWKKSTIAGLPAIEIVADAFGGRVYMLYLGNTRFISNAMLVNYYQPARRTAADDEFWARFLAGIRKAGG